MQPLDEQELIEKYLSGELPGDQTRELEARMANDPSFRARVELERQLQAEFSDPRKLALRDMMADIVQAPPSAPKSGNRWWILGLLIGALAIGVWYFRPAQPVQETPSDITPKLPEQKEQPVQQTPPTTPEPIAKADGQRFRPNQTFESRLGNGGIRSTNGDQMQMQSPVSGTDFTSNKGQVKVNFKGIVQADDDPQEFPLQLNIYHNTSSDTPVAQAAPIITNRKEQVEEWTFSAIETLRLSPGLYYFTLERKSDGELIFVGKFTVDKKVSGGK